MSDQLPHFRYHPDPVATGSVQGSAAECAVCGRARGWAYAGPVYAGEELDGEICPWCIADGSAAAQLEAEFTDTGWGAPDDVPQPVCQEIAQRTPGFAAWQQEHWLYHCGDGCAYLARWGPMTSTVMRGRSRCCCTSTMTLAGARRRAGTTWTASTPRANRRHTFSVAFIAVRSWRSRTPPEPAGRGWGRRARLVPGVRLRTGANMALGPPPGGTALLNGLKRPAAAHS